MMTFCYVLIEVWCVMYLIFISDVHSHDANDVRALLRNKTSDYDKNLRPTFNQSTPTVVAVAMEILSVQDFNEVQETLKISAYLAMYWLDEFMEWNVSEYGGMSDIVLESGKFWTPNLVLVNNADKLQILGDTWQPIRFTHEGHAAFYPGDVFKATCTANVIQYPFDSHWCVFTFTPWGYGPTEIFLLPLTDKVQKNFYTENGAWNFFESHVERTGEVDLTFFIRLDRKPQFVLVNVMMPVVFMTFLNAMVFCLPAASGERMSYSITVLLAIAVFLTVVGENLPKTSTPMSIFSYYLISILIIGACITVSTIFSLRIFYCTVSEPVTGCWLRILNCCNCRKNTRNKIYETKTKGSMSEETKNQPATSNGYHSMYLINDITRHSSIQVVHEPRPSNDTFYMRRHRRLKNVNDWSHQDSSTSREECPNDKRHVTAPSWKDVSIALDKLFFSFYITLLIVVTVILFIGISVKFDKK